MTRSSKRPDIQYRMAEVRSDESGAGISGYGAHFMSVDSYGTAIKRGAFRKTLKERGARIPVLWQHNPDWPIGRPTELKEDATGLKFDAAISEQTTYGRDAMALLRDEVPLGMSFGFQTIKSRTATDDDDIDTTNAPSWLDKDYKVEVIEEVRLWEISVVTFPSNEQAVINDVRSMIETDALTTLIEHIRAGSLSDEHAALIADLVAAFSERQEPEPPSTPLPDEIARRRSRDVEIAIAQANALSWLGVTA